jgi:cell pole-organizing protein PopZ
MSGAEPLRDDFRGDESSALEPSMEEILASIRRILADGQGFWGTPNERYTEPEEFEPRRDDSETPLRGKRPGANSERSAERSAMTRAVPPAPLDMRFPTPPTRRGVALASKATEATVAAAFETLVASRFAKDSDLVADLAREMLRPLLEAWIDEHLAGIVERLVAAEIARITRGA